ncbi:MAG: hypothetical protein NW200_01300 [Hyphomonadaceae bacterium]|nr:hypothetical protein [Hyphomonadaceae bacterium]
MDGAWRMIAVALTAALLAGVVAWRVGAEEGRQETAAAAAAVVAAAQARVDRAESEAKLVREAKADSDARLAQAAQRTRRGWCMARFERDRAEALAAGKEWTLDRRAAMEDCLAAPARQAALTD